ncbi:IS6 family transposase [Flavobacterium sp. KB82]|uniref:IS6 family transposase n=1 Tax=Flavobacterium hungaricum TaxID=2082725 RepID=A0ABR9TMY3_9FLAO|nr:IS6 family transposase [Flavobacterium hungaricum]
MNTKGHCYPKYVILEAVYFKLRFTLSYRDVEEIMKSRGVLVDMLQFSAGFINLRLSLNQR